MSIDKLAVVSPDAQIGKNVSIGPFSVIEPNVVIRPGVEIGANVLVASGSRIGKNCKIFHGAAVGSIPQDLKFAGEESTLEIGDDTVVREYCTLNRGTAESGSTKIGSRCLLMAYVHVGHDCRVGDNVILANAVTLGGHVVVDDFTIVGGLVPIHQFVKVGKHVMIGGGFRTVQDVPPYITAGGYPLKFSGLNSIGLKRRGFKTSTISKIKSVYKVIFTQGLNLSQALSKLDLENSKEPELQEISRFIKESTRGLI